MFYSIWIHETYTKPEITPKFENDRPSLVTTELYKNASAEEKIFVEEYIELDKITADFFYRTAQVNKLVKSDQTCQFLQIIFSDIELFREWVINPKYQSGYYDFLTAKVWIDFFGVEQVKVSVGQHDKPSKFLNYEEALEALNNHQNK